MGSSRLLFFVSNAKHFTTTSYPYLLSLVLNHFYPSVIANFVRHLAGYYLQNLLALARVSRVNTFIAVTTDCVGIPNYFVS